jgi:predicted nucleotide-binding protein
MGRLNDVQAYADAVLPDDQEVGWRAAGGTRVFVAYSLTDPLADEVLARLKDRYSVHTSVSIHAPVPRTTALMDVLSWADVAVAVLPPPQDRSRTNVIFEIGMAVGRSLPVLLISSSTGVPRDLALMHRDLGLVSVA